MKSSLLCVALFMTVFLSVGCLQPLPPLSPTPTSVEGVSLLLETLIQGSICVDLRPEYQVFLATTEDEWHELQNGVLSSIDVAFLTSAVEDTNFQTHALLLALRDCHPTTGYEIAIDRAVEGIRGQLQVYVVFYDPLPGQPLGQATDGSYHLARLPWSGESSTNLTIDVVTYKLWNDNRH